MCLIMPSGICRRSGLVTKDISNEKISSNKNKYVKEEGFESYKFHDLLTYIKLEILQLIFSCLFYFTIQIYNLKAFQQISHINNNLSTKNKFKSSRIKLESKDIENYNIFMNNLNIVPNEKKCYVTRGKDVVDTVVEAKCDMDCKEWNSVSNEIIEKNRPMDPDIKDENRDIKKLKDEHIGEDDTRDINQNELSLSKPIKADSTENEDAGITKAISSGTSDNNVAIDAQYAAEQNDDCLPPEIINPNIPNINGYDFPPQLNLGDHCEIQASLETADPTTDIPENRQAFNEITDHVYQEEHVPIPESNSSYEFEYFLVPEDGQIFLHLNAEIDDGNINEVLWMEIIMFFDDP